MKRMFLVSALVSLAACGGGPLTPSSNGADAELWGAYPDARSRAQGRAAVCRIRFAMPMAARSALVHVQPSRTAAAVGGDASGNDAGAFSSMRVASALRSATFPMVLP